MATHLRGLVVALALIGIAPWVMGNSQAQSTKDDTKNSPAAKIDGAALAKLIDQQVDARLKEEGLKPSPLSDDGEFLRRVYLDLIGVIPPSDKVVAFLDSSDPNKRAKVIDELLDHPRFGNYLGEMWAGMLLPRESNNRRLDHRPMQKWLAEAFKSNKSMDKIVYDLLTAVGTQEANGASTYFILNPTADKITDNVTQMFLGVRLQCAQCHNHPFVEIKQNDYWGMAAFFTKTRLSANPKQAAKQGAQVSVFEGAAPKGGKKGKNLPQGAKIVPAKFLQGEQPKMNSGEPYRPVLAKWITSPTNPFFAKAMVNRVWYQLFGRGICNPVDDMHEGNPASHPELLAQLTEQFKANGFDMKYLYRAICNSQAYQRTSRPVGDNKGDKEFYSHAAVRGLSPEQLYDSLVAVVGNPGSFGKGPKNNVRKGPATPRDAFLNFFRIDEGANPLEYQSGIPQALRLMNSPQLTGAAALNRILGETKEPAQVLERLYLATLSRRPTTQERQRFVDYVGQQADLRTGFSDVLWAMLNSSEFGLNH